ncbi:hypothetical protein [Nocardioides coralli]|uniref:arsenate reductase/protein-tyrosine-phosphatase family protein n=1 Tax=Nocardioides coralli TaxID=2872154 RepID=UPI001CA44425|nr:hypothetical protein [Nocardioides coralli]QZY29801.1 hypothetical protein K6T13_03685 [Nocardioides coralli]
MRKTAHKRPDLLLVCHANRARSPLAAHLLRRWADQHGVEPRPRIASSGVYAGVGEPLLDSVHQFLEQRGVDGLTHASRPFDTDEAVAAGLVVTFERALLRAVVARDPALVGHTFTLREVIRLTSSPLFGESPGEDLAARLQWLRPRVSPGDDDTPDPAQVSRRGARRLLEELASDVERVAPVLLRRTHSLATP